MKKSASTLFISFISIAASICLAGFQNVSPQTGSRPTTVSTPSNINTAEWFCDERWSAANYIMVGIVKEVIPAEGIAQNKQDDFKEYFPDSTVKNLLRVEIEKNYKSFKKDSFAEIINLQTGEMAEIDFKAGERYLFYVGSRIAAKGAVKPSGAEPMLYYIRSDGKTKAYSDSTETIDFLENHFQRNVAEEILGSDAKDAVLGGIVSGKAVALVKPRYPEEAKKERARGSVQVMVLVDESGQVIKAKAICSIHQALGRAAEEAALQSRFSPTQLSGKPVKVKGVIVYNFVP